MRVLIVHAHPVETSFNRALLQKVETTLRTGGHETTVLDLYRIGFDPVLSADEHRLYTTPGEHRRVLDEQIDLIKETEGLIVVYPTWWYGLPAILKGWLDRVWLPDVTFALPEDGAAIQPLMRHIRLLGGVSTYGASWLWTRYVGDPGRRTIMRGMHALCARDCHTFWLALHRMDSVSAAGREVFLDRVGRRLERIRP